MYCRSSIVKEFAKELGYIVYKLYQKFRNPPFDEYNYQTFDVFKKILKKDSNCIDIGANKGDILKKILKASPHGMHFAFEPIPHICTELNRKFGKKVKILNCALSNKNGMSEFHFFIDRPAVSGLAKRHFDIDYRCTTIQVATHCLETMIPANLKIDLIKIDVEGAEYLVFDGARNLIKKYKPVILFEFGYGAADLYHITPDMMFDFMSEMNMEINTLSYFLENKPALNRAELRGQFQKGYNYFFIAYAANGH